MGFILDGLESEPYDRSYRDRDLVARVASYFRPFGAQVALVVWLIHVKATWALVALLFAALYASQYAPLVMEALERRTLASRGMKRYLWKVALLLTAVALLSLLLLGALGKTHPIWRSRK